MNKISVIIPSYNSEKTIERCILSIIQTGYHHLEIIIVDDVSKDRSPEIVQQLIERYPDIIKLISQQENGGPAKARNRGAKEATGEYLFFTDSDTEMLPDALNSFVKTIKEYDAVSGVYYYEPLSKGIVPKYKAMLNNYFFSRKGIIPYEVFDSSRAGIRKEVFEALNGFNENLSWGMDYENEEFGYRLIKQYKLALDPDVVVKHHFPGFKKLTQTYFFRVALWMEIFLRRKKFESGGVTSPETGISSISLFLAVMLSPWAMVNTVALALFVIFFGTYLYGYFGFLKFVAMKRPSFVLLALVCNIYFTFIIAFGAFFGFVRHFLNAPQAKFEM